MNIQPTLPHYRIEQDGSSLRLILPARKNWLQLLFVSLWLVFLIFISLAGISVMSVAILTIFTSGENAGAFHPAILVPGIFMLVWVLFSIGIGLVGIYSLMWQLKGQEIIEFTPQSIRMVRKAAGFEKPQIYDAAYIQELRVSPYPVQTYLLGGHRPGLWRRNAGALAFDYGAKTIRFGDMDEAEAKMALNEVLRQFPTYGRR